MKNECPKHHYASNEYKCPYCADVSESAPTCGYATTSGNVTKWLDDYYEKRPQLDKPIKGVIGYEVQRELLPVLHSLINEVA